MLPTKTAQARAFSLILENYYRQDDLADHLYAPGGRNSPRGYVHLPIGTHNIH